MRSRFLMVVAVAGILLGGIAGMQYSKQSPTYCQTLEEDIGDNKSFEGAVACFEPGKFNMTLEEKVNETSNLRCVCRHSVNGSVQWLKIAFSD